MFKLIIIVFMHCIEIFIFKSTSENCFHYTISDSDEKQKHRELSECFHVKEDIVVYGYDTFITILVGVKYNIDRKQSYKYATIETHGCSHARLF